MVAPTVAARDQPLAGRSLRLAASTRSPATKTTAGRTGSRSSTGLSPSRRRPATTMPRPSGGSRPAGLCTGAVTRKYGWPPASRRVRAGSVTAGAPGRLGGGLAGTCTRGVPRESRIVMKSASPSA